jgi:hypothetical protein
LRIPQIPSRDGDSALVPVRRTAALPLISSATTGSARCSEPLRDPDGELIAWADDELRECLGISAPPIAALGLLVCR